MKKTLGKRIAAFAMAMAVAATVFVGSTVTGLAYTQTTGTVISDNVKVRSDASTTANQVSSLKNGDVVDIVDEATDSSGYVWYKIYVNKNEFGYVRSDLVNKKGGSSNTTATATATTSAASLPETSATATEQRNATVLSDSVNVRKGAGTAYDSVGKVAKGDTILVTGEANGTDGKTWYQVSFGDGKTGFVRSDLVAVSDTPAETAENPEGGENAEGEYSEGGEGTDGSSDQSASVSETTGDGAYSLFYTTDEEGNGVWYLYDNFGGYRVKVKELIEAAQSADAVNSLRKSSSTYKKIAIVLAILAVVLIAGIVILALKLRDSLYYEDEEEEEYDHFAARKNGREELGRAARDSDTVRAEKPERPFRRNTEDEDDRQPRRAAEDRVVRPVRRSAEDEYEKRPLRRQVENEERPMRRDAEDRPLRRQDRSDRGSEENFEERPSRSPLREAQERQARRQSRAEEERAAAPKRKARNFVGDDDDFEFEFLDLDDDK